MKTLLSAYFVIFLFCWSSQVAYADCNIDTPGFLDLWISPSGNDSESTAGTYANPKRTLSGIHDDLDLLTSPLSGNVIVHVRGGTYNYTAVNWTKVNPLYEVVIEACPGEVPVFSALSTDPNIPLPLSRFFRSNPPIYNQDTNITLRNLWIKDVYEIAVIFNNGDNNVVEGCTFENIGNKAFPQLDAGLAAVELANSSDNLIVNNRFVNIENDGATGVRELVHVVYLANNSDDNIIEFNSADRCSGDTVKARNGSDRTIVRFNYFNRSADKALFNNGPTNETISVGAEYYGNVHTFPYQLSTNDPLLMCTGAGCTTSNVDFNVTGQQANALELGEPNTEEVAAIVGGDFDQDGREEIIVAFNYDPYSGFAKVVSTAGAADNRYFHRVLYANDNWSVSRMAAGDLDGNGDLELLTAFHAASQTSVYRADGQTHLAGAAPSGGRIYDDATGSIFRVTGMTVGDFDGDADQEVITSFQKSNQTIVYTGNGITSLTGSPVLLDDTTSPYWKVTAMTSGDFSDDGNYEVITGMHYSGTTPAYYVYSGNGTTTSTGLITTVLHSDSTSPYWETTACVGGDFNDDGTDELVSGMHTNGALSSPQYKLYSANGTTAVNTTVLKSSSTAFFVRALGKVDFDGDGNLELISAIETPGNPGLEDIKIWVGNGGDDFNDMAQLYSSYFND